MKKIIMFFLLIGMAASAQQMGFNYIEITAEENSEKRIGEMFDNYMDGKEMKSGGVFLERLRHGTTSGRTHRVIWLWELDNGGFVEDADENERKAFWRGLSNMVEEWGDAKSGRILNAQFGDDKENSWAHVWDIKAEDEEAFIAAQNKLIKKTNGTFDNRLVGFGTYDINRPNGATHWIVVSGKDINDHLSLVNKLEKEFGKAFDEYFASRGQVEYIQDFMVERLKTY
tara:strand:- start:2304 stop:2987 length:684 start_codon:yes stop_codon:yes gene_type:complete